MKDKKQEEPVSLVSDDKPATEQEPAVEHVAEDDAAQEAPAEEEKKDEAPDGSALLGEGPVDDEGDPEANNLMQQVLRMPTAEREPSDDGEPPSADEQQPEADADAATDKGGSMKSEEEAAGFDDLELAPAQV